MCINGSRCEKSDEQAEDLYKLMVEVMGSNYSQDDENTRKKRNSTWETCDSRTDSLREALTESSRHTPVWSTPTFPFLHMT